MGSAVSVTSNEKELQMYPRRFQVTAQGGLLDSITWSFRTPSKLARDKWLHCITRNCKLLATEKPRDIIPSFQHYQTIMKRMNQSLRCVDYRVKSRAIPNCVTGAQITAYILDQGYTTTRALAIQLGHRMATYAGLFHRVTLDYDFQDSKELVFQLKTDEEDRQVWYTNTIDTKLFWKYVSCNDVEPLDSKPSITLINPLFYESFAARKNCAMCTRAFRVYRRKYHCQTCGRVLCSKCTQVEEEGTRRRCVGCITVEKPKISRPAAARCQHCQYDECAPKHIALTQLSATPLPYDARPIFSPVQHDALDSLVEMSAIASNCRDIVVSIVTNTDQFILASTDKHSFSTHKVAIMVASTGQSLICRDTRKDVRFQQVDLGFYAAFPLLDVDSGVVIGVLEMMDSKPRLNCGGIAEKSKAVVHLAAQTLKRQIKGVPLELPLDYNVATPSSEDGHEKSKHLVHLVPLDLATLLGEDSTALDVATPLSEDGESEDSIADEINLGLPPLSSGDDENSELGTPASCLSINISLLDGVEAIEDVDSDQDD